MTAPNQEAIRRSPFKRGASIQREDHNGLHRHEAVRPSPCTGGSVHTWNWRPHPQNLAAQRLRPPSTGTICVRQAGDRLVVLGAVFVGEHVDRAEWQADYDAWQKRDLSARRYVYVWVDGAYLQARMEEAAECMLVLIGAKLMVQTRQRRCENMATIEGRKSVAQSRPRHQIPKRHRGHQNAGSPRRLTDIVTHSRIAPRGAANTTGNAARSALIETATSIRRLGSRMPSRACRTIQTNGSTSSCHDGTHPPLLK